MVTFFYATTRSLQYKEVGKVQSRRTEGVKLKYAAKYLIMLPAVLIIWKSAFSTFLAHLKQQSLHFISTLPSTNNPDRFLRYQKLSPQCIKVFYCKLIQQHLRKMNCPKKKKTKQILTFTSSSLLVNLAGVRTCIVSNLPECHSLSLVIIFGAYSNQSTDGIFTVPV